jgi:L-cysteine/cystine lyase
MALVLSRKNLEECRTEIPALANKSYFNYGGQGTFAKTVLETINSAYELVQSKGPFSPQMFQWMEAEVDKTRVALAIEFGGPKECFALTNSVTHGCNIAMWGIEWQAGDRLLMTDSEHTGPLAIAETLARRRGIAVDYLPVCNKSDEEVLSALTEKLNPRTRLFFFSHVLWNTGQVMPASEMTRLCHERGTIVLIDGAQSAGVLPVDCLELGAELYAITGHKWLCGPEGTGALYIKREFMPELDGTFVGWRSAASSGGGSEKALFNPARFEVGTAAFPLLAGLRAAIEFHGRWGSKQERFATILANANELIKQLNESGKAHAILKEAQSGLVSFTVPNTPHTAIVSRLDKENIMTRTIKSPDCMRASLHYFTDQDEINRLAKAIASC